MDTFKLTYQVTFKQKAEAHFKKQAEEMDNIENQYLKSTVRNLSSYELTDFKRKALSYGLDQHIPKQPNPTLLESEFEPFFYQNLLKKLRHLPEEHITKLKTEMRSTCGKYGQIYVPHKYKKTIKSLKYNQDIVVLKQDKGRTVVILDKTKYTENACNF